MTLLAHYMFNEAPGQNATVATDTVGTHHGVYEWGTGIHQGLISTGGANSRHTHIITNDAGAFHTITDIADLRLDDEMTVMFWCYFPYSGVADAWHPFIEVNGVDDTQPENMLFAVSRESNNRLSMEWEHSAGTDVGVFSANDIVGEFDVWMHCAVVRQANASNYDVLFYIDGVLADTQDNGGGGYTGPDGGGNSLGFVGRNQASTAVASETRISSLRVYDSAENAASVLSVYNTELAQVTGFDAVVLSEQAPLVRMAMTGNVGNPYMPSMSGSRAERVNSGFTR